MKRKVTIALLSSMTVFSAIAAATGVMAWFKPVAKIESSYGDVTGFSEGAYYESGDGLTLETAFVISKPRHLYNLAWLQYLGYYNKPGENGKQYYFKLKNDIDMTGWHLPPIGTEEYPFIGNFDGQGHVVSNLTTTNIHDNFDRRPARASSAYFNNASHYPDIVGFFGVIGDMNNQYTDSSGNTLAGKVYSSSINELKNVGLSNITVETESTTTLIGMAAGFVDATVSNVAVDEGTTTVTKNASCFSNSYTTKLSDYGVVGYATENYKANVTKAREKIYGLEVSPNHEFNAIDNGDDQGWGGSINMKTIYNRIVSLRRAKGTDTSSYGNGTANWRVDSTYYDGVEKASERVTYSTIGRTNNTNDAYSIYNGFNESGHEYIGNYNVYARAASSGYGEDGSTYGDQQYLYLSGGHYENRTYKSYYNHSGYYIKDGSNYLAYDGSNLSNTTNANDAMVWQFSSLSGTTTIYYTYENHTYYLVNYEGNLLVTDQMSTTWTLEKDADNTILKITNNGYKIDYYDGRWCLLSSSGSPVYKGLVYINRRYMSTGTSGSTPGSSNDNFNNAADFMIESGTNYLYYMNGAAKMYVAIYYVYNNGNPTNQVRVINSANANNYYYFTLNSNNVLTTVVPIQSSGGCGGTTTNNTDYYIGYSNGSWISQTSTSNAAAYNSTVVGYNPISGYDDLAVDYSLSQLVEVKGPDSYQSNSDISTSSSNSHMYYTAADTTYIPLNVESDLESYVSNASTVNSEISSGHLDPKDSNTGYIIAGSTIASDTAQFEGRYHSNIRVSRYALSNVNQSYSVSAGSTTTISDLQESKVYTINTSGTTQTMQQALANAANMYPRYSDSKTTFFNNSLASSNNGGSTYTANRYVYGLHFMASTISINSIVNASKVSVLGKKSNTYQFPVDSIDFNLKQKGVINFFAGTYFTDNDSFFSLHEITRNNDATGYNETTSSYESFNTIEDIKEIEEIWSTDVGSKTTKYANIYKYKGKSGNQMYSVPYRFDGNQNKFVMDKSSDTDTNTPYVYATMGTSDFNSYVSTYGYTLKFKTSQIGKQNSLNSNCIYYFEFPMNEGEYCLGSVTGGTGAYLLYLDIGANAAKTQRTLIYEHFDATIFKFEYPLGVAIVQTSEASASNSSFDATNTSNAFINAGYVGSLHITRTNNDVEFDSSGGLTNAKPTLVGELMWDSTRHEYNIHLPDGGDNLSDQIVANDSFTGDVRRVQIFDYNINLDELTLTIITDTKAVGESVYTRTFYQEYSNGESTTDVSEMKIYNTTTGIKLSVEEASDQSVIKTYIGATESSVNTTLLHEIAYIILDDPDVELIKSLQVSVDESINTGRYYKVDAIVLTASSNTSVIKVTVTVLGDGTLIVGETTITEAGTEVTLNGTNP